MGARILAIGALVNQTLPFTARFDFERCMSRGVSSSVYEGVALDGSRVVIRRAHPHLVDARARASMMRDAKNAMKVSHRNVIPIEEVADLEGDVFVVSKYVEGASLAQLVAKKPLPRRIALRIALDACAGLAAIHAARSEDGERLLHRDISPDNIIVGTDGVARLADFGVTKQLVDVDDAAPLRPGKCGYLAPEYILSGLYDARADVFALGVVLWELFAGRRLFDGQSDDEVLHRALFEDAPSLVGWGVPDGLEEIVGRAVTRPANYRLASASRLEVEIEHVANGRIASHQEVAIFVAALASATEVDEQDAASSRPTKFVKRDPLVDVNSGIFDIARADTCAPSMSGGAMRS